MALKETRITSFSELHELIENIQTRNTVYRGEKSTNYKLLPQVGRIKEFILKRLKKNQQSPPLLVDYEKKLLRSFKDRAIPYIKNTPKNDWEWLVIAQHYGLATRLLDWSRNPLVAAYFAVEKEHDGDSVIYALLDKGYYDYHKHKDPFAIISVKKIYPSNIARRIEAQSGLFTVHPSPEIPLGELERDNLHRIVIPKSYRVKLRKILRDYGMHRGALFPDMDGIAYLVNEMMIKSWK